ncbi:MAG TPA: pyrroline-5-carboxylate reductase [Hyphomicrobiaceae bacterium]|nr:pyrroline-5-carboxylate reductase [Hyphomicrobiaceae bacterium]
MALSLDGPLVLAGAGKMGGALLAGWLKRGLDPRLVVVQDPGPPGEVAQLLKDNAIQSSTSAANALEVAPAVIVVAVKPQAMEAVFPDLAKLAGPDTLILSIAAGKPLASFEKHLPQGTPVIRAMPNTPAAIGRGITVCVGNAHVMEAQRVLATSLLEAVGEVGWVDEESAMDAVTALSGSGPAYVFLLAEAMAAAGERQGLAPELAARLARATVAGAGELLHLSGESAGQLRQNVTSPGGTTAAALSVLMREGSGFAELMAEAIAAATKRGRELAG